MFNYCDPRTKNFRPIKSVKVGFQKAMKRAGIRNLQFRDLRRTFGSRLHDRGVDPLIIQRLLRHSSFKISEQVYIFSNFKLMKSALELLDEKERNGCDTAVTLAEDPPNPIYLQ